MTIYSNKYSSYWTKEKSGDEGYDLKIEVNRIELTSYRLPRTKWSGASSENFTFDEFTENSRAYEE